MSARASAIAAPAFSPWITDRRQDLTWLTFSSLLVA
jgi:hypothetical protein